jgi:mono/diheme cytochrome c family protein
MRPQPQPDSPWPRLDGLRGIARAAALALVAASVVLASVQDHVLPESSPASRGARLVVEAGCLSCHGGGSGPGLRNPERNSAAPGGGGLEAEAGAAVLVPSLASVDARPAELRRWIHDGIGPREAHSAAYRAGRERKLLQMPAYGGRLTDRQVDDLVVHLSLQRAADRPRSRMPEGEQLARDYGCFGCHGELGQGGVENPRSLKGYIPGFYGRDFAILTDGADRDRVREWIRDGVPEALVESGFMAVKPAKWILQRQAVAMPAFGEFMTAEQIEVLVDYCLELHRLGPLGVEHLEGFITAEASSAHDGASDPEPGPDLPSFVQDIQPILERRCVGCHGQEKQKSDYRLDTRDAAMRAGSIGRYKGRQGAVPGDAAASLLIEFVECRKEDEDREVYPMPPLEEGSLTGAQIAALRHWIDAGMEWPPGVRLRERKPGLHPGLNKR